MAPLPQSVLEALARDAQRQESASYEIVNNLLDHIEQLCRTIHAMGDDQELTDGQITVIRREVRHRVEALMRTTKDATSIRDYLHSLIPSPDYDNPTT